MVVGFVIGLVFGGWLLSSGRRNLSAGTVAFKWNFFPISRYSRTATPIRFWSVVSAKLITGGLLLALVPISFFLSTE